MYLVDEEECTGCGACLDVCPVGAISIENQVAQIDEGLCTSCGACGDACPQGAIYEYAEVPALHDRARVPAPSMATRSAAVSRPKAAALTRQEKVAAAAVLVTALGRIVLRLAGRVSSRGGGGRLSTGKEPGSRPPMGGAYRGRHRWRGGS